MINNRKNEIQLSKLVWYANVPYLIMLIISDQIRKMCDQRKI